MQRRHQWVIAAVLAVYTVGVLAEPKISCAQQDTCFSFTVGSCVPGSDGALYRKVSLINTGCSISHVCQSSEVETFWPDIGVSLVGGGKTETFKNNMELVQYARWADGDTTDKSVKFYVSFASKLTRASAHARSHNKRAWFVGSSASSMRTDTAMLPCLRAGQGRILQEGCQPRSAMRRPRDKHQADWHR